MITLPPVTAQHTARVASLRAIVNAAEAVDSYCVDYLTPEGIIDADSFARERVGDLTRTLAELDGITSASDELAQSGATVADAELFAVVVRRARMLADAIREAMGQPITTMTYETLPIAEEAAYRAAEIDDIEDTVPRSPFAPKPALGSGPSL